MLPTSETICGTCSHKSVCKYAEDIARILEGTGGTFTDCKHYKVNPVPTQDKNENNELKALQKCERCGKAAYKLFKCEACGKRVCSNCAEIEQELDVNTGNYEEHVRCLDCAEED